MNGKLKKPVGLIILTILSLLIGSAGYFIESEEQASGRYYLVNSGGSVLFEHQQHSQLTESCAECHHKLYIAAPATPCSDCHDEDTVADDFTHADLKSIEGHQCSFCHQINSELEPQSCRSCHPKNQEAENRNISCAECHDDSYDKELMSHDEMQEIESHTCEGCHNAGPVGEVYHQQCNGCHNRENPEKFSSAEGKIMCGACHLK